MIFNLPVLVLIAFVGGILSFLSPCTAIILPTFFAYTFNNRVKLIAATVLYVIGFSIIYIPVSLGFTYFTILFFGSWKNMNVFVGIIFIVLSIVNLVGLEKFNVNFSIGYKNHPNIDNNYPANLATMFSLGIVTAVATAPCIGPVLGIIITLASGTMNLLTSIFLVMVYLIGFFSPLLVSALIIEKSSKLRNILKGKLIKIRFANISIELHSTNLISSALFLGVGTIYLFFGGFTYATLIFTRTGLLNFSLNIQDLLVRTLYSK